jgi:2-oxoglutarate ferredoxin oxidoreductase subunit alpha
MCSGPARQRVCPPRPEQGDLWQVLGAAQGDFPKVIVAPSSQIDLFKTMPELFNLVDKYQCPGLVLTDLLISEGTVERGSAELNFNVKIDRGEIIFPTTSSNGETKNPFSGYNR